MELTQEIEDKIKLLIVETIKEMELGKSTPSADYPDFESWKDNLIELDRGLKFAPEDFYVKNRKLFTWDEAMEYEGKVLKPNGFRLPTLVEWTMAFCEYGQGSYGFFWSATPNSASNSYDLRYASGSINPQDNDSKGYGFSVRCVAIEENDNRESR